MNVQSINVNGSTHVKAKSQAGNMSQRYNDNTKRPKPNENVQGIFKIFAFCWKIQKRASGTVGVTYLW